MYRVDLINGAMAAQHITAEKLSEMTGLGMTVISAIRNGKQNATVATLQKIAFALGLKLSDLFAEEPSVRHNRRATDRAIAQAS